MAEKWFGAITFQSTLSTVHVIQGKTAVHLLTAELPWTLHRFQIRRFSRESRKRRNRVQNDQYIYSDSGVI